MSSATKYEHPGYDLFAAYWFMTAEFEIPPVIEPVPYPLRDGELVPGTHCSRIGHRWSGVQQVIRMLDGHTLRYLGLATVPYRRANGDVDTNRLVLFHPATHGAPDCTWGRLPEGVLFSHGYAARYVALLAALRGDFIMLMPGSRANHVAGVVERVTPLFGPDRPTRKSVQLALALPEGREVA